MSDMLWIPGKPVPFQRTRYNRATNRFYQLPDYADWKEAAAWEMKRLRERKLNGAVGLDLVVTPEGVRVIVTEIADSHRPFKKGMRGDLDNYGKAVLDAANQILYDDDRQVVKHRQRFSQWVCRASR